MLSQDDNDDTDDDLEQLFVKAAATGDSVHVPLIASGFNTSSGTGTGAGGSGSGIASDGNMN